MSRGGYCSCSIGAPAPHRAKQLRISRPLQLPNATPMRRIHWFTFGPESGSGLGASVHPDVVVGADQR
eukprot:15232751-Alexandrium_andersonii.AAC.1